MNAGVAIFRKDRLVACIDASVSVEFFAFLTSMIDAGHDPAFLFSEDLETFASGGDTLLGDIVNQHRKGVAAGLVPTGKAEGVSRPCGEQFAGRVIVGRCGVREHDFRGRDGGRWAVNLSLMVSHYDTGALDGAARGCLAAKGDWWELPKDSADYQRERRQQTLDRAMKAVDQSGN